jgi:23S rRNA pseudouridine1911/1915/1917 synthase
VGPNIIYEDRDVVVVDKPAGLIVHSDGRTEEPTLADWILERWPLVSGVGEPWTSPQGEVIERPGIVHRLDRMTSGVMVIAKTTTAHEFLKKQFQGREVEKEYRAFVYGHPKEDGGVIEAEIRRTRTTPPRWTAEPGDYNKRRAAVTEWKVLRRGQASFAKASKAEETLPVSELAVFPRTGRTHQIRVHLKYIHHPVVADPLYAPGMPALLGFTRPALHAHRLTVVLPSGEKKIFEAPLPEDFVVAEKSLS